jgi:hypothetical protein
MKSLKKQRHSTHLYLLPIQTYLGPEGWEVGIGYYHH